MRDRRGLWRVDEVMDNGYPQFTESKILSEFITVGAHQLETPKAPMAVTNAVSWRSEGLKYQKNEVFLDVIESVNIVVNSAGQGGHGHPTVTHPVQVADTVLKKKKAPPQLARLIVHPPK